MVRFLLLTVLVVIGLVFWPQLALAVQSTPEASDSTYKLEGMVVNAETGRPIQRALVEMYSMGKQAVLTGPQGEFSFDKLGKGTVMVRVMKPGFFALGQHGPTFSMQNVEVGPNRNQVVFKLEPECVITGEVTDENGEPVEGATVEALGSHVIEGYRELVPERSGIRTDEDGLFRMAGLQPGKYFLSVKAGGAARRILGAQSGKTNQSYPLVVYFPGVTDFASATPIDLAPGQRAHAQLSLSLVPAFRLSGTVIGIANFKQVSPPMIVDAIEQPLSNGTRWDSGTGGFEFPSLPAGTYTLRVFAMADDNHRSTIKQTVTLNRDTSGVTLALPTGATIPVSVRTEFTEQRDCSMLIFGNGKNLDCKQFPALVTLTSVDSRRMQSQAQPENTDDPSTLALRGVMPGRYRVQVHPMVQAYVRSLRSGTTDLLREDLVVPAGGNVSPIEVVLRDDGAKVKIHIEGENLPPLMRILLLPESAPNQQAVSLNSSGTDDVEYSGLAPGDYKVLAFESPQDIEYENPEVIEKYSAKTARVTLTAQGSTNVTVELIREGE